MRHRADSQERAPANQTASVSAVEDGAAGGAAEPEDEQAAARTRYILFRKRYEVIIKTLLTVLDSEKISALERVWLSLPEAEKGLRLDDFVQEVRWRLPDPFLISPVLELGPADGPREVAEAELLRVLCHLFQEIDVNGDGVIEWEEFTKYIVEESVVSQHSRAATDLPPYAAVEPPAPPPRHTSHVDALLYVPAADSLLAVERHSPVVKVYDAESLEQRASLRGLRGAPLAVEYLPAHRALVTSAAEMTLALWDFGERRDEYRMREGADGVPVMWPTPHAQTALRWDDTLGALFSGSAAGLVHLWDVDHQRELASMLGHTDEISCLEPLRGLDTLASASADASVGIWDVHTCTQRQVLRGHARGVLALAHCPDRRLLVSVGFDHEAFVWSPFVGTLLFKLRGHAAPLVGAEHVPDSDQLLTGDADGVIKLWDLRSSRCVQTFHTEGEWRGLSCMTAVPRHRRLVGATKTLFVFEQQPPALLQPVAHDDPVLDAVFNPASFTLLTAAPRAVKVWDALDGSLLSEYRDFSRADMSSVCLDDRARKIIVGDHDGDVKVLKYANGALMKRLEPHAKEVSALAYSVSRKCVLSTSWDRTILLQDEMDPDAATMVKAFDGAPHKSDITRLALRQDETLLASVANDGTVRVWDVEMAKLDAVLSQAPGHVATDAAFLGAVPALALGTSGGAVEIWTVRDATLKYKRVAAFAHRYQQRADLPGNPRRVVLPPLEEPEDEVTKWMRQRRALAAEALAGSTPATTRPQSGRSAKTGSSEDRGGAEQRSAGEGNMGESWSGEGGDGDDDGDGDGDGDGGDAARRPQVITVLPHGIEPDERPLEDGQWSMPTVPTCLAFDDDTLTLFTGDESGDIRAYAVRGALEAASLVEPPALKPEEEARVRRMRRKASMSFLRAGPGMVLESPLAARTGGQLADLEKGVASPKRALRPEDVESAARAHRQQMDAVAQMDDQRRARRAAAPASPSPSAASTVSVAFNIASPSAAGDRLPAPRWDDGESSVAYSASDSETHSVREFLPEGDLRPDGASNGGGADEERSRRREERRARRRRRKQLEARRRDAAKAAASTDPSESLAARAEDLVAGSRFNYPSLQFLWRIRGHKQAVNRVVVVEEPPCLLTCSFDGSVKTWTKDGRCLGVLQQNASDPQWALPVDAVAREREEHGEASRLLAKARGPAAGGHGAAATQSGGGKEEAETEEAESAVAAAEEEAQRLERELEAEADPVARLALLLAGGSAAPSGRRRRSAVRATTTVGAVPTTPAGAAVLGDGDADSDDGLPLSPEGMAVLRRQVVAQRVPRGAKGLAGTHRISAKSPQAGQRADQPYHGPRTPLPSRASSSGRSMRSAQRSPFRSKLQRQLSRQSERDEEDGGGGERQTRSPPGKRGADAGQSADGEEAASAEAARPPGPRGGRPRAARAGLGGALPLTRENVRRAAGAESGDGGGSAPPSIAAGAASAATALGTGPDRASLREKRQRPALHIRAASTMSLAQEGGPGGAPASSATGGIRQALESQSRGPARGGGARGSRLDMSGVGSVDTSEAGGDSARRGTAGDEGDEALASGAAAHLRAVARAVGHYGANVRFAAARLSTALDAYDAGGAPGDTPAFAQRKGSKAARARARRRGATSPPTGVPMYDAAERAVSALRTPHVGPVLRERGVAKHAASPLTPLQGMRTPHFRSTHAADAATAEVGLRARPPAMQTFRIEDGTQGQTMRQRGGRLQPVPEKQHAS